MQVQERLAGIAAVIAALAVAVPVASASTATTPVTAVAPLPIPSWVSCPVWYGMTNPATGCAPYWVYAYGFLTTLYGTLFPNQVPALP